MVLMFHDIVKDKDAVKTEMQLSAQTFEKLLTVLIDEGWHPLCYSELLEMIKTRQWREKSFYVSFDDIYESVYTIAYPILKKYKIPFIVFLNQALIDTKGYITTEQVKRMLLEVVPESGESSCVIGNHGMRHGLHRNISDITMAEEYNKSRQLLEDAFGVKVDSYAFPYGGISEVSMRNIKLLKLSNYTLGFSTYEGSVKSAWFTSNYFLPRVNVSEIIADGFIRGKSD